MLKILKFSHSLTFPEFWIKCSNSLTFRSNIEFPDFSRLRSNPVVHSSKLWFYNHLQNFKLYYEKPPVISITCRFLFFLFLLSFHPTMRIWMRARWEGKFVNGSGNPQRFRQKSPPCRGQRFALSTNIFLKKFKTFQFYF